MTMEQFEEFDKELALQSFRAIRCKFRSFDFDEEKCSNDELAGFVKGIVELESNMYNYVQSKLDKN